MPQLPSLDVSPALRKQILIACVIAVLSLLVVFVVRLATLPSLALLYGDLEPAQAGEVLAALDKLNTHYEVRGQSVFVARRERDRLRIELAANGLPSQNEAGYEILDQLSGFGTTSQMFDAAYWRAKEGELARTIAASGFVKSARVHISSAEGSLITSRAPMSASVFLSPRGTRITPGNVQALQYLVASAVGGLSAENVSIIDASSGTLLQPEGVNTYGPNKNELSVALENDLKDMLEAIVGLGNARVRVHIDTSTETETLSERTFEPNGRVAVSSDRLEISETNKGGSAGAVTVASNVPNEDAESGSKVSEGTRNEVRERTNFEVSEIKREVLRAPGSIDRVSVAVLVNYETIVDEEGIAQLSPRSEAQLDDLKEIVESAVGFQENRGDRVTIKALPFEHRAAPLIEGDANDLFIFGRPDVARLVQISIVCVTIILMGVIALRSLRTVLEANQAVDSFGSDMLETNIPATTLTASSSVSTMDSFSQNDVSSEISPPMTVIEDIDFQSNSSWEEEMPLEKLKEVVDSRQVDTLEILRSWIETGSETKLAS